MNLAGGAAAGLLALLGAALPGSAQSQVTPSSTPLLQRTMAAPRWSAPSADISLVALEPDDPLPAASRRPRHALRVRSSLAESAFRSIGIEASECAVLLRMRSRSVAGTSGTSLVLNPQMHLACRF